MRILSLYIYVAIAIFAMGCSDMIESSGNYGADEGAIAINFDYIESKASSTLDQESFDELMANSILKIYNSSNVLIRRYEPATEAPDLHYLVEGDYTVTLSIGSWDSYTTDDDNLTIYGESDITIVAQQNTEIDIDCGVKNTKISVSFDDSLEDNLVDGYTLTVAATDAITDDMLASSYKSKLSFSAANNTYSDDGLMDCGSGYIIADDPKSILWRFEGETRSGDALSVSGIVASEAVAGGEYTLSLKYDKYFILSSNDVVVDESTDDKDDHFSFSPQPTIDSYEGGFVASENQIFGDSYMYDVKANYTIESIEITAGENSETLSIIDGVMSGTYCSFEPTDDDKSGVLTVDSSIYGDPEFGGIYSITINVYDEKDSHGERVLNVVKSGIGEITSDNIDLWLNKATIPLYSTEGDISTLSFNNSDNIHDVAVSYVGKYCYEAIHAVEWESGYNGNNSNPALCYTPKANTGVWAGQSYSCEYTMGNTTYSTSFTTEDGDTITNGNMDSSSLPCYTEDSSETSLTWGSGNNSITSSLCTRVTFDSETCAKLTPVETVGVFAAGNLFYGTFKFNGYLAQTGTVSFGQKFTWSARPKSIKLKYAATTGGSMDAITINGETYTTDRGRIYLAITDWSSQHTVTSGSGSPTGSWDPNTQTSTSSGNIIGYASFFIDESTTITELHDLEIPIQYYDTETMPSSSKYSLVISCATSAYGDYLTGSTSSLLYVDDFKFGY